jgi:transposase
MKKESEREYVRRSSKDYSMSFKLKIIEEIEHGFLGIKEAQYRYGIQGNATIATWLRKHGNFDWENKTYQSMPKSPEQKLLELEQKVKLLEKQKSELEKKLDFTDKKAIFFDMMIDIAEQELRIPIRKKYLPKQSDDSNQNKKNR